MSPEFELIAKYAPAIAVLIAMVILTISLIIYVKKSLFTGVVSQEMFNSQLEREGEFIGATKEATARLEEISRQLESLTKKVSEEIRGMGERVRTLELVFSDNIDVIRDLSLQVEKARKNIPETEVFLQQRREKKS